MSSHSCKVVRLFCRASWSSLLLMGRYDKQSSAKSQTMEVTTWGRSFIWMRNNSSPRTVPWGSPECTAVGSNARLIPLSVLCLCSEERGCLFEYGTSNTIIPQLPKEPPVRYSIKRLGKIQKSTIARTWRQPNYPNHLAPKRGSQNRLSFDPNLMWSANGGNVSIVQAGDTLSRGVLSPHCSRQPLIAPLITCS